jgi:hypothetical protein
VRLYTRLNNRDAIGTPSLLSLVQDLRGHRRTAFRSFCGTLRWDPNCRRPRSIEITEFLDSCDGKVCNRLLCMRATDKSPISIRFMFIVYQSIEIICLAIVVVFQSDLKDITKSYHL